MHYVDCSTIDFLCMRIFGYKMPDASIKEIILILESIQYESRMKTENIHVYIFNDDMQAVQQMFPTEKVP